MSISTIMCIVLGIWLLFAIIAIIVIGCGENFVMGEWIATFLLIFVPPIWAIIFIAFKLKSYNERRKIKKRRKKLGLDKEEQVQNEEKEV